MSVPVSRGSAASSARTALDLLTDAGADARASDGAGSASSTRVSSGAHEALFRIMEFAGHANADRKTDDFPTPRAFSGFPASVAGSHDRYATAKLSEAAFRQGVLEALASQAGQDAALKAAIANGTIKVRRAEEVRGLNYKRDWDFQFGDGGLIQGVYAMRESYNLEFVQQEKAAGKRVITGWQGGGVGSFYVTY